VVCPGGGFSYVGSIHEGFPYALELSQKGYNVFVLQYRVGDEQTATRDLAAAVSFILENASMLAWIPMRVSSTNGQGIRARGRR
jgi:hypothetical protein